MIIKILTMLFTTILSVSIYAADDSVAEKPNPSVGDVHEFDQNTTVKCKKWETSELDSNGSMLSTCGKYVMYLSTKNGYNMQKIIDKKGTVFAEFKPYFPGLSFPLKVGKKWQGKYTGYTKDNGAKWTGNVTCEVKAIEDLTIVGKTLKTFRTECVDKWTAGSFRGTGHATRWYSPDTKSIVKISHKEDSRWNMELKNYKLK